MKPLIIFLCLCFQLSFSQKELKHEVYFETDQHDIPETEHSRLLLFLSKIEDVDIEKVTIYGFTDDRGSDNYNLVLSQNRADAIKEVFSNNEFDESKMTNVDGKGKILVNIIKENDLNKIRGLNRKVEIVVTPVFPPKPKEEKPVVDKTEDLLKGDLKEGDKILLDNLLFRTGYSYLTKESKVVLDRIAEILVDRTNVYFTIEGHVCCTQGERDAIDRKTKKRNLSVARAKYIYDYLVDKGVKHYRMKFAGMRRKQPLGGEPQLDRRVEILVTRIYEKK
ncbi:OmpA family protein [Winogradskyella pacifica]|uniref:Outer membrane protein OmpA-like peptidoglycan-associated protein n=1 Tax=Winogradskyella pacifica TaxID=664642 RepID=A0A3D9LMT0_9FLAO|nr:OmpA family protein [Winogradskyella pacifica]REE08512.1 outer membrane protein OmpA-like peptidoglycan-associated protein [Winogradskyella pacifica]